MIKYNVLGGSATDLTALASVLQNLALLGRTDLFDSATTNEAGTTLTISKGGKTLFVWDNTTSGSSANFNIYVGSGSEVSISNNANKCPTFLLDLAGCIYIGRASSNSSADAHASWLAIAPSNSGETAFLVHAGTSAGNFGQNVNCAAYGDQQSPAYGVSWTPLTTKNCSVYYPIPTNCAVDSVNWTTDCYALAFTQYPLATTGKTQIDGATYYSNGYAIFRDLSDNE